MNNSQIFMDYKVICISVVVILLYLYPTMFTGIINKLVRNFAMKSKTNVTNSIITKTDKPPFILFASIGNPEKSYKGTRHSVGHLLLKEIADRQQFNEVVKIGKSSYYANPYRSNIMLYESTSFMNTSGKNIRDAWENICNSSKLMEYNPVLVVIHDELDLALGKIKVKKQMSSHKGHNGLRSIHGVLGGGFIAISVGISRPESRSPKEVADYVLSRFTSGELNEIRGGVLDKVETVLQEMLQDEKYIYEVNKDYLKKLQK